MLNTLAAGADVQTVEWTSVDGTKTFRTPVLNPSADQRIVETAPTIEAAVAAAKAAAVAEVEAAAAAVDAAKVTKRAIARQLTAAAKPKRARKVSARVAKAIAEAAEVDEYGDPAYNETVNARANSRDDAPAAPVADGIRIAVAESIFAHYGWDGGTYTDEYTAEVLSAAGDAAARALFAAYQKSAKRSCGEGKANSCIMTLDRALVEALRNRCRALGNTWIATKDAEAKGKGRIQLRVAAYLDRVLG